MFHILCAHSHHLSESYRCSSSVECFCAVVSLTSLTVLVLHSHRCTSPPVMLQTMISAPSSCLIRLMCTRLVALFPFLIMLCCYKVTVHNELKVSLSCQSPFRVTVYMFRVMANLNYSICYLSVGSSNSRVLWHWLSDHFHTGSYHLY